MTQEFELHSTTKFFKKNEHFKIFKYIQNKTSNYQSERMKMKSKLKKCLQNKDYAISMHTSGP